MQAGEEPSAIGIDGFLDLLERRRVTRHFEPGRLPLGALEALVAAGSFAPSGGNRHPIRYIAVQDRIGLRNLVAVSPGIYGEPATVIVICIDWNQAPHLRVDDPRITHSTYLDAGAAMQSILLGAEVLGLGACPIMSFHRPSVRHLLRLPDHWTPYVAIALGRRRPAVRRSRNATSQDQWFEHEQHMIADS